MKKAVRKAVRKTSPAGKTEKDISSDIAMIVDEVKRKSEERRKSNFSAQRTPEFLMSVERAAAMGKKDKVASSIRNMFLGTEMSLDRLFGDILPKLREATDEMLGDDSVWSYVKFNGSFPANSVKIVGSQVSHSKHEVMGGATEAIMTTIEAQAATAEKDASEAYSRAVDAVIEDLRIRLLRKIGCIKVVADRDAMDTVPVIEI